MRILLWLLKRCCARTVSVSLVEQDILLLLWEELIRNILLQLSLLRQRIEIALVLIHYQQLLPCLDEVVYRHIDVFPLLKVFDELEGLLVNQLLVYVHEQPNRQGGEDKQNAHPLDPSLEVRPRGSENKGELDDARAVESPRDHIVSHEGALFESFPKGSKAVVYLHEKDQIDGEQDEAEVFGDSILILNGDWIHVDKGEGLEQSLPKDKVDVQYREQDYQQDVE